MIHSVTFGLELIHIRVWQFSIQISLQVLNFTRQSVKLWCWAPYILCYHVNIYTPATNASLSKSKNSNGFWWAMNYSTIIYFLCLNNMLTRKISLRSFNLKSLEWKNNILIIACSTYTTYENLIHSLPNANVTWNLLYFEFCF